MMVLSKNEINALLAGDRPLIAEYINLEEQLQPNGFDLTVRQIASMRSAGTMAVKSAQRVISGLEPQICDSEGYFCLAAGSYVITFNEIVSLPKNVMALGQPRSSLLRCGVTVNMAVWDAGYSGRGQALLTVFHPGGYRIQVDARVAQLVFFKLSETTEGYQGQYQGENIQP